MRKLFALAIVLTGCASPSVQQPSAPVYEDPFVRLYNEDSQTRAIRALTVTQDYSEFRHRTDAASISAGVPLDLPFDAKAPVAMTISENAQAFLTYADSVKLNSQYLVTSIVQQLRARMPGLILLDDLATSRRSHMSTSVIVDVQAKFGMKAGDLSTLEVSYFFFNEKMIPITRYLARSENRNSFPTSQNAFDGMSNKVLRDLNSKLGSLLTNKP